MHAVWYMNITPLRAASDHTSYPMRSWGGVKFSLHRRGGFKFSLVVQQGTTQISTGEV